MSDFFFIIVVINVLSFLTLYSFSTLPLQIMDQEGKYIHFCTPPKMLRVKERIINNIP